MFFTRSHNHLDLHSFPTRRSSDLAGSRWPSSPPGCLRFDERQVLLGPGQPEHGHRLVGRADQLDRKSTRLNSSHANISYAVFCLKKKKIFRYVNDTLDSMLNSS